MLSVTDMPPGVPVAAGIDSAKNAALLAIRILAANDEDMRSGLQPGFAGRWQRGVLERSGVIAPEGPFRPEEELGIAADLTLAGILMQGGFLS